MTTTTLRVNCTARPVRLAFLLKEPDAKSLQQVFSLNTVLWGGICNPVVILDGSQRLSFGSHLEPVPYEQELLQLLKDFDPDVLINYDDAQLPTALSAFKERTFGRDSLRWNPWGLRESNFFLEVWPFLHEMWREFRLPKERKERYAYIDQSAEDELKPYLIARFGLYPETSNGIEVLKKNFLAESVSYDKKLRETLFSEKWVFPISLTTLKLDMPFPEGNHNFVLFALNPANPFDVVDYWNLRATGCWVLALPIDHYQDFADGIRRHIDRAYYPINPEVMNNATLVKARSVGDETFEVISRWIADLKVKEFVRQHWVPRFGERGYRVAPELKVRQVASKEATCISVVENGSGSFQGPIPECEFSGDADMQHWAMDIRVLLGGDEEHTFRLPWLRPQCDALTSRVVGHGWKIDAPRVSKLGFVAICKSGDESRWIHSLKVVDVLAAYLKDSGFSFGAISSPGRALQRIIEQLGGLWSCKLLQDKGVRSLVRQLAHGSRIHAEEARKILWRESSAPTEERKTTIPRILERLVREKIVRQGVVLQCSRCGLHDWYHLSDFTEDFKCKKCFHLQPVPPLDKNPWWYVSDGLFRLEGELYGCITTLLSLLFLLDFLGHDMKYVSSFDYSDGAVKAERDFAVFSTDYLQEDVDVIIGEAKTAQPVPDKQMEDTKRLGERTGAYLAFCTQAPDFADSDKAFFRQLVMVGQKPILLTEKHLNMDYMAVSKYKSKRLSFLRDVELLSRLTIIEVLGKEFAHENRVWL